MSSAKEILADGFVQRYGVEDMYRSYYTCFPVKFKQHVFYECAKGHFDAVYSDKHFFEEPGWLEVSVPKFVPKTYHESYLNFKHPSKILKIINETK